MELKCLLITTEFGQCPCNRLIVKKYLFLNHYYMAAYDIQVVKDTQQSVTSLGGLQLTPALAAKGLKVKANTKAIALGEPVILDGSNAGYVTTPASGSKLDSTSILVGFATSTSTQTASADGVVEVDVPSNGVTMRIQLPALATGSLAESILYANRALDCATSTGVWTFDQSTSSNGIAKAISYDATKNIVDAIVRCNYWLA